MKNTIKFKNIKLVLMDIEGTTTSISFVHDTLFPYAYEQMERFFKENPDFIKESGLEDPASILRQYIKEDKKDPFLKKVQGFIWKSAYESGKVEGHIYPDVKPCLEQWKGRGLKLAIYSSGSVKAQKLLFGYSEVGDLNSFFDYNFDTQVGHKIEVESYECILSKLQLKGAEVLFLSDTKEELDAAKEAKIQTCQLVRDEFVILGAHPCVTSFTEILV